MKSVLFLHGLGSAGSTKTAEYMRTKLPEVKVISPDIPLDPFIAMKFLNKLCFEQIPDVIVGTSMGAMYAQQLRGFKKILVNPAFHVSEVMNANLGINKYMNLREDGETEFCITEELCNRYVMLEENQFLGITDFDVKYTYAFFGTEDTLVNGYDEYLEHYTNATKFPGGHALLQKWVKAYIIPCVQKLLNFV